MKPFNPAEIEAAAQAAAKQLEGPGVKDADFSDATGTATRNGQKSGPA